MKIEKAIKILEPYKKSVFGDASEKYGGSISVEEIIELLKEQDEIIQELLKVGYPHNFQREEPWIRNYMYAITDVIKKAVRYNNDSD